MSPRPQLEKAVKAVFEVNSLSRLFESILHNRSHQSEKTDDLEAVEGSARAADKQAGNSSINVIEIVAVGILTAAAAYVLSKSVGWLGSLRINLSQTGNVWVLPFFGMVGGVQELVREVSSTFVITAGLACFAAATMSDLLGNHSLDLSSHTDFPICDFRFADIPNLIILGIVCGALGSFFNWLIIKGMIYRSKIFKQNFPVSIGLAGLICGLTVTLLPQGMHNFAGIKYLIIGHTPGLQFAATALSISFFITIISYVSGAPGGLFGPSLTIGAATGYLLGATELGEWSSASNAPDLFALAGMGAFFSGVARVPITATVIVFEITRDFNLLLPLLMTTMVAYTVGEKIYAGSVYDRLLDLSSDSQKQ